MTYDFHEYSVSRFFCTTLATPMGTWWSSRLERRAVRIIYCRHAEAVFVSRVLSEDRFGYLTCAEA